MIKKKPQQVWAYQPQRPSFTAREKAELLSQVRLSINSKVKLSQKVSRLDMRANRIYLYEWVEPVVPEGAILLKPLIEGKYLEYPYARITLHDTQGQNCTVDWQRHNNQWLNLYQGTLLECIHYIEEDDTWFA